ncbi:hypothetical protein [Mycobacterium sp.]|uniref:hypothetical protein n=1 Tax=Mycobacterium sp. TaxID=1785 RepID=UPI003C74ABA5
MQLPDGTVEWTSPIGDTYTTKPGWAVFFPALAAPTGELRLPTTSPAQGRRQTRAAERAVRIASERRINEARIAV